MKDIKVAMVVGSNGIGRLLAEKMRTEGMLHVVTVAQLREVPPVNPSLHGMRMIDPREHDKKCWKEAKRYGRR